MRPADFPEANCTFGPPPDLDPSQVVPIRAWMGETRGGSVDGSKMIVTAWQPSAEEIAAINAGAPIFLSVLGGLPPHFLAVTFADASNPA